MAKDRKPGESDAKLWRRATGDVKPKDRDPEAPGDAGPSDRKPPDCKPREKPSDPEAELWRRATGDVRPLDRTSAPAPAAAPTPPASPAQRPPPRPPAQSAPPELRHGESPGVDRRTADNLRRGKLPIEARLDLHGMTQIEAERALTAFIAGQQEAGRRCVLVVTGKGREGAGVLRAAVPQWLNAPELRPRVLTFAYAQPRDGGQGALYILLRRRR